MLGGLPRPRPVAVGAVAEQWVADSGGGRAHRSRRTGGAGRGSSHLGPALVRRHSVRTGLRVIRARGPFSGAAERIRGVGTLLTGGVRRLLADGVRLLTGGRRVVRPRPVGSRVGTGSRRCGRHVLLALGRARGPPVPAGRRLRVRRSGVSGVPGRHAGPGLLLEVVLAHERPPSARKLCGGCVFRPIGAMERCTAPHPTATAERGAGNRRNVRPTLSIASGRLRLGGVRPTGPATPSGRRKQRSTLDGEVRVPLHRRQLGADPGGAGRRSSRLGARGSANSARSLVDGGNPFGASATIGNDGAVSPSSRRRSTGYTIVSADSLADATAKAKSCPIFAAGGAVQIYEALDM